MSAPTAKPIPALTKTAAGRERVKPTKEFDAGGRPSVHGQRGVQYFQGPSQSEYEGAYRGFDPDDPFTRSRGILDGNIGLSRIRRSALENPLYASYVRLMKLGVIGSRHIAPTFSRVSDKMLRDRLRREFEKWAMDCGVGEESSLWEIQMEAIESMVVDGRSFLLIQKAAAFSHGFRLLPLPKELLADYFHDTTKRIYNGMEYDENMQLVAYHFRPFKDLSYLRHSHAGDVILGVLGTYAVSADYNRSAEPTRVPAEEVIDLHPPSSIARAYNFPSLAASFNEGLRRIASFDDSVLDAYRAAAFRGGFLEIDKDAPIDEGVVVPEGMQEPNILSIPEFMARGHGLVQLSRGVKFAPYQQAFPGGNPFDGRKELIRTMTSAMGPGYIDTNSDLEGASFSSVRHAFNQAKDAYRHIQAIWVKRAAPKILRHFLTMGMEARPDIMLSDMDIDDALMSPHDYRAYEFIDPDKSAKSMQALGAMGLRSPQDMAREIGNDFDAVCDDLLAIADKLEIEGEKKEKISQVMALFYPGTNASAMMASGLSAGDAGGEGDDSTPEETEEGGDTMEDTMEATS